MRRYLLIFLALTSGFAWLYPAFSPPGIADLQDAGALIGRILRIACPVLLLTLSLKKIIRAVTKKKVYLMIFASFIFLPLGCIAVFPDINYLIYVVLPLVASGMALMGLLALSEQEISLWLSWVGVVALLFILVGLTKYGFEMPSYYGRPRLHLGFVHPTQTASALLSVIIFFAINLNRQVVIIKNMLIFFMLTFFILMMYFADSRNTMVTSLFFLSGYIAFRYIRRPILRKASVILVMLMVIVVHLFIIAIDLQSGIGFLADKMSSGRLAIILELVQNLKGNSWYSFLLGPSAFVVKKLDDAVFLGFAAIDSVYISLLVNYGILQLVSFLGLMLFVGLRLSRMSNSVYIATWSAVMFYFTLDAQGITASNLIIFSLLAISIKASVDKIRINKSQSSSILPLKSHFRTLAVVKR